MKRSFFHRTVFIICVLVMVLVTTTSVIAEKDVIVSEKMSYDVTSFPAPTNRISDGSKEPSPSKTINTSLVVEPLSGSLTKEDLATILVGGGVSIVDVSYAGMDSASGAFFGGENVVGFESGILLTSGSVYNVVGPNVSDSISTNNNSAGDSDLDLLSGYTTYDASVLEIEFVPTMDIVYFRYVFTSDEYNEYVNSSYNDVFAFFVNGENCATVEGDPVSINQINYGNPYGTEPYSHPEFYINNDLSDGGGQYDTEMDGITSTLTCWSQVSPGQINTLKLAIADASDHVFDSAVFLQMTSLVSDEIIELTGLEVTQAIQDLTDSVFLVKNKPTFVRAHVRSLSGTIFNSKARLIGRRNGSPLPGSPLYPINPNSNIDVYEKPIRSALNDSFYFQIPRSWLSGTIEFELVGVTQNISCKDHTDIAEDCKVEVTFVEIPEPEVRIVGIRWTDDDGVVHIPEDDAISGVVEDIEAQYPINNLDWDRPYDWNYDDQSPPDLHDILLDLMVNRLFDGCISSWPINCERLYYGLLVDYPGGDADYGLGEWPGYVAAGYWDEFDPAVATHEIGHNLGRAHTNCRGDEGDPGWYPYKDGEISQFDDGDYAFYGFHISKQEVINSDAGDLMGYCRPQWSSDYTYNFLRTAIEMRYGEKNESIHNEISLVAEEQAILISGRVELETGNGSLGTILQIESPTDIQIPEPGPYSIHFLDLAGNVISEFSFNTEVIQDASQPTGVFALLLPWPVGVNEITLETGDILLDSRIVSSNSPIVDVVSPSNGDIWSGGSAVVNWTASDIEGDELEFTIQYSTDAGVTWLTLITGWTSTSYEVNLLNLPGSDQAQIRVLATDGVNTSQDFSEGLFIVNKHTPLPYISSPKNNSFCVEEQLIIFSGGASDAEDGQLQDASLQWQSNLDGFLGSGESVDINCSNLSEGEHVITLVAVDSDGQIGLSETVFEVYRFPIQLPKSLDVGPKSVTFYVGQGLFYSPELVGIRNNGDGTISWSSNSNQSWLSLSIENGFTPANVRVKINAFDLLPGTYFGSLEIAGEGALNSPQIIEVKVIVMEHSLFLPAIMH